MKIAVLSGKGGAGKTLVSVNLASVINNSTYIDCDVEEPNGRLFFKSQNIEKKSVYVEVPREIKSYCNGCKKCVEFCKFNALAYIKDHLMVFDEVCHSCHGCLLACPNNAIEFVSKEIGIIERGIYKDVTVLSGILNLGEASGVPIIKELLKNDIDNMIIDCPPGSACSVMECIKDADYCILVSEPTIFGLHNLKMIYDLVKFYNKSCGVVLNKHIDGENIIKNFCNENRVDVIGTIPWSKELGEITSNGIIVSECNEYYKNLFRDIYLNVRIKEKICNN